MVKRSEKAKGTAKWIISVTGIGGYGQGVNVQVI